MKKKAIYPGSFDPLTYGHLDIIRRGAAIFDEVIVAILQNPSKQALFTLEERLVLARRLTKNLKNVKVDAFSGLLVDYVKKQKNPVVLRGLRVLSDFEYEFQLAAMNRRFLPSFEILFMMPDEKYEYVSSSLAKELARINGPLEGLVAPPVATALKKKLLIK